VVNVKQAVVSAVFVFYVFYMIFLLLAHLLRDWKGKEKYGVYFHQLTYDLTYRFVFWFGLALIMASVTPVPVGPVILFIILVLIPLFYVGIAWPKLWFLRTLGFLLTYGLLWGLFLWMLINPWCRFYFH